MSNQAFSAECVPKNYFSCFSTKPYGVGTQKKRLSEFFWAPKTYVKTDG